MNKKNKDYSEQNKITWKKYIQNDWIAATTLTAPDGWSEIVLLNEDSTGAVLLSGGISDDYTRAHNMTKEEFEERYGIQMIPKCNKSEDKLHEALAIDMDRIRTIAKHSDERIRELTKSMNNAIAYELANDYEVAAVTMYLKDGSPVIMAPGTSSHSHRNYTCTYKIDDIYTVNDSDCMKRLKNKDVQSLFDYTTADMLNDNLRYTPHVSEVRDSYDSTPYYRIWGLDLDLDTNEEAEAICKHFDMIERARINTNLESVIRENDRLERDYKFSQMDPEERSIAWFKEQTDMMNKRMASMQMWDNTQSSNSEKMTAFVKGRKKY